MFNPPKTLKEAQAYRYRVWGGNPKGSAYSFEHCAYEIPDGGRSPLFHQCTRKKGFGPEKLFCQQHAKLVKE